VLQCVAVCIVLCCRRVAVICSDLQCVLQCVAVCYSVLQRGVVELCRSVSQCVTVYYSML